jgi:predicted RNA-binding Zn-ribbon protein involved in translation (DUF1610 family)
MSKGLRLSEKWFKRGLWLIAVVFASFLIGLGSLIVGDLPQVESRLEFKDYLDPKAQQAQEQIDEITKSLSKLVDEREQAQLQLVAAENTYNEAQATFNNWLATRSATQRSEQDPEVIARTRELDALKLAQGKAQRAVEGLDTKLAQQRQAQRQLQQTLGPMSEAAQQRMDAELRSQELRVFLYRLALTLPLLLGAVWLFVKKRKSQSWPFVWGFIFFALFAFFVELVPYLPDYGGYVRQIVGIVLTVVAGRYAIRAMQTYLDKQKAAEAQPDTERRTQLDYDLAITRLAKKVCPGCERPADLTNPENNHCPHCGITLFDRCGHCQTRKNAFARYCHACGTPSAQAAAEARA